MNATDDARYPIYSMNARWMQDGEMPQEERARMRWWPNDPGEGRIWNSAQSYRMFREDPGLAEAERFAREVWWPAQRDAERPLSVRTADAHPSEPQIDVRLAYHESWALEWFSHKTFDVGQTDAEALASFERYVERHAFYQDWPHDDATDRELEARGISHRICLMGAEDRWRWTGGGPGEDTAPPCRCEHCKAQGVIRIGH